MPSQDNERQQFVVRRDHHARVCLVVVCDSCDLRVEVGTMHDATCVADEHEATHIGGPT